jgi:hypothetical protein
MTAATSVNLRAWCRSCASREREFIAPQRRYYLDRSATVAASPARLSGFSAQLSSCIRQSRRRMPTGASRTAGVADFPFDLPPEA